ncbi:MAG: thioredoxin family protein [Verrucomicrobiota bacterium]
MNAVSAPPWALFFSLILLLAFAPSVHAGWTTDYAAALARARAEKKLLLLDFGGSDWCGGCKLLDQVFQEPAFRAFADARYIEVSIDFPHAVPQSNALRGQNEALADRFMISELPTVIVVNADGRELGRVGYAADLTADAMIAKLKRFR